MTARIVCKRKLTPEAKARRDAAIRRFMRRQVQPRHPAQMETAKWKGVG